MIPEEYIELVQSLLAKSRKGEANWQRTFLPDTFVLNFSDHSISLHRVEAALASGLVTFALVDSEGTEIESFSVDRVEASWKEADELFTLVRRKVYDIDAVVKRLTSQLGKDGSVGLKDSPHPSQEF